MSEPRMRHYSADGRNHVETWWTKRGKDGRVTPLASDNLRPVSLPEGLETQLGTIFGKLQRRERTE